MSVNELPFEERLSHVLWVQRNKIRDATRAPEWELQAGIARVEEIDPLVARRNGDTLANRLVDYGELAFRLSREELTFRIATGYQRPARFWTPYLALSQLVQAGIRYLGTEAVPGLLRACLRDDLGPQILRRLGAEIEKVGGSPWATFWSEFEVSHWDRSLIEEALAPFPPQPSDLQPSWGGLDADGWRERQVRMMIELLRSEHTWERWRAVEGLVESRDPRAEAAVMQLEADPEEVVRQAVADALKALRTVASETRSVAIGQFRMEGA